MTTTLKMNEICDDISSELDYDITALQNYVTSVKQKLLPEQKQIFDKDLENINREEGALFFLNAPGGAGKTFYSIYCSLKFARIKT